MNESPASPTVPGAGAGASAIDGSIHATPSRASATGAPPLLPMPPRNPLRSARPPTPFKQESNIFLEVQKKRLRNAQARIEPVLAAAGKLPDRFFDDQRTPTESLVTCLTLGNIECSPNEAHRSLNFITALIALATGVHHRNDLSDTTRLLFENDHDIHKAEASKLLQRLNADFPGMANIPIGTIGLDPGTGADPDPRIPALQNLLARSHDGALNICILGVETRGTECGKQHTHLVRQGPILHGEKPTKDNGYLVYDNDNGRFLPLRERPVLTNPCLAQHLRYRKKSFSAKLSCIATDMRAPFSARVEAFQLADPALYEKAIDKATGTPKMIGKDHRENAYIKEWLKRTDPDYKLKKPAQSSPTVFQKIKSALPFTLHLPKANPYLEHPTSHLSDLLNDVGNKPSRKQRKLIKKAIYRNYVLARQPDVLNPVPPTPVALAAPECVENVFSAFAALLQPDGDPSRSPLADSRFKGIAKLFGAAQVSMIDGIKTGNKAELRAAQDLFREGLQKLKRDAGGDDDFDTTLPLHGHDISDVSWLEIRAKVMRLEQSLADLAVSQRAPAHERTPEIAAVLRQCGFSNGQVDKFSSAVESVVTQRQAALQELRGFMQRNAEPPDGFDAQLATLAPQDLIEHTRTLIQTRSSVLINAKKHLEATREEITDLEHFRATHGGDDPPSPMPGSLGFFLADLLESTADTAIVTEIEAELARLAAQVEQEEILVEAHESFATSNFEHEAQAEIQASTLENLAPVWNAMNAVWSECDAFKKRTAAPENHPGLLDAANRTLRGPLLEVLRHSRTQAG